LHPKVLVMNNLSPHKVAGVRQCIESAAAELLCLPPHSPDMNPIRKSMGKAQTMPPIRKSQN